MPTTFVDGEVHLSLNFASRTTFQVALFQSLPLGIVLLLSDWLMLASLQRCATFLIAFNSSISARALSNLMEKSDFKRASECVDVFPNERCRPFLSVYSAEMNRISKNIVHLRMAFSLALP